MTMINRPPVTNPRMTRPTVRPAGRRLTRNQAILRGVGAQDAATIVWQEALAYMLRRPGVDEYWATAVATEVFVQFQKRPSHFLAKYGSLRKFACVAAKSRWLDLQGIERGQRGEGRTLVRTADGGFRTRRRSVPTERWDEGEGAMVPVEFPDHDSDFADTVVGGCDLEAALRGLSDAERRGLMAIVVEGRTTVEVAAAEGVVHTTIIKRNRKAVEKALQVLGEGYRAEMV